MIYQIISPQGTRVVKQREKPLSVTYKNSIGGRRKALKKRILSHPASQKNLVQIRIYKKKMDEELNQYCFDLLNWIDYHLIKTPSTPESEVLFHIIIF